VDRQHDGVVAVDVSERTVSQLAADRGDSRRTGRRENEPVGHDERVDPRSPAHDWPRAGPLYAPTHQSLRQSYVGGRRAMRVTSYRVCGRRDARGPDTVGGRPVRVGSRLSTWGRRATGRTRLRPFASIEVRSLVAYFSVSHFNCADYFGVRPED